MSCEEVRDLLPEYAEPGLRPAGVVEVHVASCPRCRAELASYRELLSGLTRFREIEEEPPAGYLERTLAIVPRATRTQLALEELRGVSGRVVAAARRRPAVSAFTGAAIGAAAIGLIAWRRGRRTVRDVARAPELATS